MNERIKEIRKHFKLNQAEYGARLGITRDMVSNIELGRVDIKDFIVKLICKEFNIDYLWLTQGIGEMVVEQDDDILFSIDRITYGENDFHKRILKFIAAFDDDDLVALERLMNKYDDFKKSDE